MNPGFPHSLSFTPDQPVLCVDLHCGKIIHVHNKLILPQHPADMLLVRAGCELTIVVTAMVSYRFRNMKIEQIIMIVFFD
jgi:hypothetical protein